MAWMTSRLTRRLHLGRDERDEPEREMRVLQHWSTDGAPSYEDRIPDPFADA